MYADGAPRCYLDNAATSWPKPHVVYDAVELYQRSCGAAVGRGATRQAVRLQQTVNRCRRQAALLLNAESPATIVFTSNGTDALNLALHGLLQPGDHVITSTAEHNSVLRPLRTLQQRKNISVDYAPVDGGGVVDPRAVAGLLRPRTKLIALTHASNVTGALQPVDAVAQIARDADVRLLIDAAQTAGHTPIDLQTLPLDLLACSGHKGLLGPLGTGLLYLRPGMERLVQPQRQGGTGTDSESEDQPEQLPDRYEAGNHNAPGLVGLDAALNWISQRGVAAIREHELQLTRLLKEGLAALPRVQALGPRNVEQQVGVVSVTVEGADPQELAVLLDEAFGIETRAGLHCAPRMHAALGTLHRGGTVRFSLGPFSTEADVLQAVHALDELCSSLR